MLSFSRGEKSRACAVRPIYPQPSVAKSPRVRTLLLKTPGAADLFRQHHAFDETGVDVAAAEIFVVHDLQMQRDRRFDRRDVKFL